MTFENYLIKISFEAILYKNIRIFYKDYLSNGVVEILEEPQLNKITLSLLNVLKLLYIHISILYFQI